MEVAVVRGDLLEQNTEAIVNAWNRNVIPWWLLIPTGVSGAIKKHGGFQPFIELGRMGPIPLGQCVKTSAGKLSYKCIFHVASINLLWCASRYSIYNSVINSTEMAVKSGIKSIAFPILGAGAGGISVEQAESIMLDAFREMNYDVQVVLVRFEKK